MLQCVISFDMSLCVMKCIKIDKTVTHVKSGNKNKTGADDDKSYDNKNLVQTVQMHGKLSLLYNKSKTHLCTAAAIKC